MSEGNAWMYVLGEGGREKEGPGKKEVMLPEVTKGEKDDVFLAAEAKVKVSSSLFSVYEKKGVKIAGIRLPQTPAVWEYNFCETFQICFFLGYAAEKLKC